MICFDEGIFSNLGGESLAWFQIVFDSTQNVLMFVSNLVILIAIWRYWSRGKMLESAKPSTIIAIGLSVSSITTSVSASYYFSCNFFCSMQKRASTEFWTCMLKLSIVVASHYTTGVLNVAIAVDRYVAIVHVMKYEKLVTAKRVKWIVAIIVVFSFLEAQVMLVWNYWKPGVPCFDLIILPQLYILIFWNAADFIQLTAIIIIHWKIHIVTKKVKERIATEPVTAFNNQPGQTMISVVPMYIVTWGPYVLAVICSLLGAPVSSDVLNLCATFSCLNYFLIPLRYSLYNVAVKNALTELFYFLKCKGRRLSMIHHSEGSSEISAVSNKSELPKEELVP